MAELRQRKQNTSLNKQLVCQEPSSNGRYPGICGYPQDEHSFRHIFQEGPVPDVEKPKRSGKGPSIFKPLLLLLLASILGLLGFVLSKNGWLGGEKFPDFAPENLLDPQVNSEKIEVVARLPVSPGNVAVSKDGRVFFSFHPENRFATKVAEWLPRENRWIPYPNQAGQLTSVLSVRIFGNTLFALDYANFAIFSRPRLVAYDLQTNREKWTIIFDKQVAPMGSMLNDFVISPDGSYIYIADTSVFRGQPGIIMIDVVTRTARRVLDDHTSLVAKPWKFFHRGSSKPIAMLGGLFIIRPAVDSIALNYEGHTLYYSPVSDTNMYTIPTSVLLSSFHKRIPSEMVKENIMVATKKKTASDGLTSDRNGGIYITDFENNAIHRFDTPSGKISTILHSDLLRWPDGLGWGPDNYLYITCSALHEIWSGKAHAPFHILRVKLTTTGRIGQ